MKQKQIGSRMELYKILFYKTVEKFWEVKVRVNYSWFERHCRKPPMVLSVVCNIETVLRNSSPEASGSFCLPSVGTCCHCIRSMMGSRSVLTS